MVKVAALGGVGAAMVDMCMYGLRVKAGDAEGLARKTTRLLSNSTEVIKRMQVRCVNLDPRLPQRTDMSISLWLVVVPVDARFTQEHSAVGYAKQLRRRRDC